MKNKRASVWVIAEQVDCRILAVSFQLIGQARKLADALDTTVESVILGDHIEDQAQQLIAAGADKVYMGLSPQLEFYQPDTYTAMIVKLAKERLPSIILIGSTSMGKELAPLIAARLQTGLTAHCIDLVLKADNVLEAKIPAYGGLLSIICPQRRPQMATVAQGVFPTPDLDQNRTGAVIPLDIISDIPQRIQTLEVVREASDGIPLESAPTVVAGGAGAGDKVGWDKIAELASTLNAALGCTRPAVDEGWADLETMIGQSGKMISPEVYIGVGLSGEQQHMVGIADARIMIAINSDARSPVFEQVDYGIVDDCREFIPELIKKIKAYQDKQVTC
jgi:electron transfer flavoprotein alpha subunit